MPDLTMTLEESFRRGVYPYSIGGVKGLVDPLKAFNRMYVAVPDFDALVERFFAPPPEGEDPAAANARGLELMDTAIALEPAVLAGFHLSPLADDGSGVSISEEIDLLGGFLKWHNAMQADRAEALARRLAAEAGAYNDAMEEATTSPEHTETPPCPTTS